MKRRTFVAMMAAVMAAPRATEAQKGGRSHPVGLLTLNPRSGSAAAMLDSLRQDSRRLDTVRVRISCWNRGSRKETGTAFRL